MKPHRQTFHGYAAGLLARPEWRVAGLVFQAGRPKTRGNSITGGGQIYGHEFVGMQANVLLDYSTGTLALEGSGQIPSLPAELIALFGGTAGIGS
jgi:hypothetical protein